ncbi:class I adenylate-forming enzyme family protein [Bacillus sp. V59.32b]|uniref:class I adenylate-forming enzyme family protein n=1 Tax=Bacillus sp. V59.32b TaxID=1758642 RepID=UPI000E3D4751|nr:long-chain fatty acid--CoA ligase [Bacillus sp. V59.32b]RFU68367.1 long-chain-fatty-acid--CoA ligase [Bacillus sp. V59.32b]
MNLKQLLETNIQSFGEYPFLYYNEKQYTNTETRSYADQIAGGLKDLGIRSGDRVMVCMPNCPEVIFSYQGIVRAGAVIVPVMFTLHPKEIHYIALNSGAKAIITSSLVKEKVGEALDGLPIRPYIISVDEQQNESAYNLWDLMKTTEQDSYKAGMEAKEDDTAVILYTSGTTGRPKGVCLTHKNLYSNALNSFKHNETERDTTLGVLPLAHVFGLTVSNICFLTGSSIVVFPKFDPKEILAAIGKYQVKSFSGVPAMIHALVSYPLADQYDCSSLEFVGSGSAPLPIALMEAFREKFKADVFEGYGLSEAAPVVTSHRRDLAYKPGSVGVPIPGVEIKIIDESGIELPRGQVGELLVRGENVTPGYFQNEEESKRVLKDSWLHTGDLAKIDEEGYLFIVDRKKDLIIRGGFNIYPRDVEEILNAHEKVSEVAVVGLPDESMGEEVVACIVKKPGVELSESEVIEYCQKHLAKNKTPRRVLFIEALPRNGVGKILKTHLRKTAGDLMVQEQ